MESFSVISDLNEQDWNAYRRAVGTEINSSGSRWFKVLSVIAWAAIAYAVMSLKLSFLNGSFYVGALTGIVLLAFFYQFNYRSTMKKQKEASLGRTTLEVGSAGIRSSRNGMHSTVEWSAISKMTQTSDYFYLWLKHHAAFIVPIRDLPVGVSPIEARNRIQGWMSTEVVVEPKPIDGSATLTINEWLEEKATGKIKPKQSVAGALLRMLVLRSADGSAVSGSDLSIVFLMALSAILWVVIDGVQVGGGAEFSPYNFPNIALVVVALLLVALIFSRLSSPKVPFRQSLVVLLAVLPVIVVSMTIVDLLVPEALSYLAYLVLGIYVAVYASRALKAFSGVHQTGAAMTGVILYAIASALAGNFLFIETSLWFDAEASKENSEKWAEARDQAEQVLFDQRLRIDERINSLQRPVDIKSANFFVGFAGVGEQKVFAEEIKLAEKTISEQFGIAGRSLLLINDRRDVQSHPLATGAGLSYALSGLVKKMDIERDVLFLSLSSHGSEAPELSVSNTSFPLNDLTGDQLASALDESGIKWRVVVISACHAGAFIKYLQNPNTIVITAAAAERTSFGCSDDRDLTYFGEAFYRDALPKSKSLEDAFNAARSAIEQRERAEGRTPSNPQGFFGEEIRKKLASP